MTKEELEKEAGDYADEHAFRVPYDGSNKFYDDVDFKASKEGYLAGAEPREKRIEELEKENAELKRNKKTVVHLADCLEEKMKERIEELETRCNELFFQCNKQNEQLTQAEEIIKGLLSCCRNYPQENAEKVEQAEQFLRETDIDNAIQKANEGLDLDKIADEVEQDIKGE